MRRMIATVIVVCVLAGSLHAVSGPGGRLYVSVYSSGTETLMSARFDENWNYIAGSLQTFSAFANSGTNAQYAGDPVTYSLPTTQDGYGTLLMGVYYDNADTMDTLMLSPSSTTLGITKAHDGIGAKTNQFDTYNMTQAFYDKGGVFSDTGKDSLIVTNMRHYASTSEQYHPGWATDEDGDGVFDGAGDTTTAFNVGRFDRYYHDKFYENWLVTCTDYFSDCAASPWPSGFRVAERMDNGDFRKTDIYYISNGAGHGGAIKPSIAMTYSSSRGPQFDIGDVDGDGVLDVYFASDTDGKAIWRAEDLNGDGDAMDDGEITKVFTFVVDNNVGPWGSANTLFGGGVGIELVDGGDAGWSMLLRFYTNNYSYWDALGVIGLADNGLWDGTSKVIAYDKDGGELGAPNGTGLFMAAGQWMEFQPVVSGSAEIPEPGTLLLIGTGILGALGWMRRRRMT